MTTVRISDAKNQLSKLIDQVERGERITITRPGSAVAQLVPVASRPSQPLMTAEEAIQGLIELSKHIALGDDLSIKEMIEEGRP